MVMFVSAPSGLAPTGLPCALAEGSSMPPGLGAMEPPSRKEDDRASLPPAESGARSPGRHKELSLPGQDGRPCGSCPRGPGASPGSEPAGTAGALACVGGACLADAAAPPWSAPRSSRRAPGPSSLASAQSAVAGPSSVLFVRKLERFRSCRLEPLVLSRVSGPAVPSTPFRGGVSLIAEALKTSLRCRVGSGPPALCASGVVTALADAGASAGSAKPPARLSSASCCSSPSRLPQPSPVVEVGKVEGCEGPGFEGTLSELLLPLLPLLPPEPGPDSKRVRAPLPEDDFEDVSVVEGARSVRPSTRPGGAMSLIPEISLELGALSGTGAMAKLSVPPPPRRWSRHPIAPSPGPGAPPAPAWPEAAGPVPRPAFSGPAAPRLRRRAGTPPGSPEPKRTPCPARPSRSPPRST